MGERVTIADVAERAHVAISSVSAALNARPGVSEETRARILAAAAELGYVPSLRARSLAGRRAFTVGLVVQREPVVVERDPFFIDFIGGIEQTLDVADHALILQTTANDAESLDRLRRLAADRRVDGVILTDLLVDDPRIALVTELDLPAVGINPDADFPLPAVTQDHSAGVRALLSELIARGHTRIGHVAGPARMVHARERERLWREALASAGLPAGPRAEGDFSFAGGLRAAEAMLTAGDAPTAVFCANDLSALGFMAGLQRAGIEVPAQVSVVGFDDTALGRDAHPPLTTVRTSAELLGAEAARLLLDVIDQVPVTTVAIPAAVPVWRGTIADAPGRKPGSVHRE